MVIFTSSPIKRFLLQDLKKRIYLCVNKCNNSNQNFPKGIIKDNCVYSPYTNIPINTTDNLHTLLWSNKSKMMNNTALVCSLTDRRITYGELKSISQNFGNTLLDQGIKPGQVVGLVFKNFIEFPLILMSAISAGLIVCSINPEYTPDEIKHQLVNSGAVAVLTYLNNLPKVKEAVSKLDRPIKMTVLSGVEIVEKKSDSKNSDIIYANLFEKNAKNNEQLINPDRKSDDLFHISHSSGTTGLPKGIWLSHGNFVNNIVQLSSVTNFSLLKFTKGNQQEVVPLILPIFHNFGLTMLFLSLYVGSKIILIPKFDKFTFLSTLEKFQTTTLFAVPPIMQYILDKCGTNSKLANSLENVYCAGAALTIPDFQNIFTSKFPNVKFRLGWGLSEGTCYVTANPPDARKFLSCGIPIPNVQLKIIDTESGQTVGSNCEGEICFKGPQKTKGYINNPKANAESIDGDGWFHSGDIGYYDKDGYIYIVDRLKDMIKVKGFQVSPTELEELLKSHELVRDAAVIGYPHPRKGEAPAAFIETNNTEVDKKDIEEELKKFLESKVASFKQIEKMIFVDNIPKSLSGKILKRQLRTLITEKSGR